MSPALPDHGPPDRRSASSAGFALAPIHLMLQLKAASFAVGIDVIGDRGSLKANRGGEDIHHGAMQPRRAGLAQAGGDRSGMDASLMQRFVGIDIAHASQKSLIEEQRLDLRVPFLEQLQEIVERNSQRIRTQRLRAIDEVRAPLDPAEVADVVVDQQSVIELEDGAGVGSGLSIEQELPGHAEMDGQNSAVEPDDDEFAVPFDGVHLLISHTPPQRCEILPHYMMRSELCVDDPPAGEFRRERSNDGFDFREFRHTLADRAGYRRPRL